MQAAGRAVYAESVPGRLTVCACLWMGGMGWDFVWCLHRCRPGGGLVYVSFCSFLRGRSVDADAAVIGAGMRSSYQ